MARPQKHVWYSRRGAARAAGVHLNTLDKWRREGRLKWSYAARSKRLVRIRDDDLEACIAGLEQKEQEEAEEEEPPRFGLHDPDGVFYESPDPPVRYRLIVPDPPVVGVRPDVTPDDFAGGWEAVEAAEGLPEQEPDPDDIGD